jgi:hypothetical protein
MAAQLNFFSIGLTSNQISWWIGVVFAYKQLDHMPESYSPVLSCSYIVCMIFHGTELLYTNYMILH